MKCRYSILLASVAFAAFLLSPAPGSAADAPSLGSAGSFAVLAGTAVTCTDSTLTGDVGGIPITQTGCTVDGTVHLGDAAARAAYADFLVAYAALADAPCDVNLTGQLLAGMSLTPGVYCFDGFVAETGGVLTLNGPPKGIWIFKIGTGEGGGYLEATGFSVVMAGGGQACNVFWGVAGYATLTTSNVQGTILAGADITVTGGTSNGEALAGGLGTTAVPTGAVTLTGATVAGCEASGGRLPPGCRIKVICSHRHHEDCDKKCDRHDKDCRKKCDQKCDRHDKDGCDRDDKDGCHRDDDDDDDGHGDDNGRDKRGGRDK
jgi:hypothetical protein